MIANSGELFKSLSRVSRRLWNIRRRLLSNVPILIQYGEVSSEDTKRWADQLKEYSGKIFAEGLVLSLGPTIAVMGPPGTGKSMLVNQLLNLNPNKNGLPTNNTRGERLPILILHKDRAKEFCNNTDCQVLYINLDRRKDEIDKEKKLTYKKARELALEDHEYAGWLLWFVDNDLLKKYNIFLAPALETPKFWLNNLMKFLVDSVDLNLLVIRADSLEEFEPIIEKYKEKKTLFIISSVDKIDEKRRYWIAIKFEEEDPLFYTYGNKKHVEKIRKILQSKIPQSRLDENKVIEVDEQLFKAQETRGNIEKALMGPISRRLEEFMIGPVPKKFDEHIQKIYDDFYSILRRASNLANLEKNELDIRSDLQRRLGKLLYKRKKQKVIDLGGEVSLSEEFSKEIDEVIMGKLRNRLFADLEPYVRERLELIFAGGYNEEDLKEILRLEWPAVVLYVHLVKSPDRFMEEVFYEEISKIADKIVQKDTELGTILGDIGSRSIIDDILLQNIDSLKMGFQMEVENVATMFMFEKIDYSIAREKLFAFLFESLDKFEEQLRDSLKNELERLKTKYLERYYKSVALRKSIANPTLLQEALSKARIEMDEAIDILNSIL